MDWAFQRRTGVAEYRVAPNTKSSQREDQLMRVTLWGAVSLLLAITVFALIGARSVSAGLDTALAVAAGAIVMGAVGGAYIVAWRNGLERAKRNVVFLLTEKELIARRNGCPDVRIGLSEIKALYKQPGKLIVASPDKSRLIAIPEDIEGYGNLRSQLVKYGEITEVRKRPVPISTYVPTLLCWFSWALVLFSKEIAVVRTAASFALFSSAWYSFRVGQLLRRSPKRHIFWFVLATSWVAALWVVYQRIFRN